MQVRHLAAQLSYTSYSLMQSHASCAKHQAYSRNLIGLRDTNASAAAIASTPGLVLGMCITGGLAKVVEGWADPCRQRCVE